MHRTMVAALTIGATLLAAAPAIAHAFLKTSTPPVGATIATPPTEVTISFTEDIEPSFSKITVQNAAGNDVTNGAVHAVDAATIAVPLKKLVPGTYEVAWRAVSVDTHRTQGKFTFSVKS